MKTVTSRDGTRIAYEQLGSGPPLLLVDGAFCRRAFGPMPALAALLQDRFTVVHYDRRGRGDSTDAAPGAPGKPVVDVVDREIDDVRALVDAVGGEAYVYGTSSGAVLAARAVAAGVKAKKLALYEAPLALDGTYQPQPPDVVEKIAAAVAADRRGDAVKLFMRSVGVPALGVFFMSLMPSVFKGLKAVAHTLPYDYAVLGDTQRGGPLPAELAQKLAAITAPTLALSGGKSPAWMKHAAETIAGAVKDGRSDVIAGQAHDVAAKAIAPALVEFFA
jgi:pimeloyl-ACP methyl ester carboxylesterase